MNFVGRYSNLIKAAGATLLVAGVSLSCTKGGTVTGNGSSSGGGALTVTKVYPTSQGVNWTTIALAGRVYVKGLAVSVTGTCTRGIDTIRVNEGGPDYAQTATCALDGTFTWNKTYTAIIEEGDKTLTFTAYDVNSQLVGAVAVADVRIDATVPALPVVTTPAATPFQYNGLINQFNILGTCAADVVKLTGPGGVDIIPVAGTWAYTATLLDASTLNFTFYTWDSAGNESAGVTQQILWSPTVIMYAGGAISGGPVVDGITNYSMESSSYEQPGEQADGITLYGLETGFNYITNTVRAQ